MGIEESISFENKAKRGMHVYGVFDLDIITRYLDYRQIVNRTRLVVGTARTKLTIDSLKHIYTPENSTQKRRGSPLHVCKSHKAGDTDGENIDIEQHY
jgi:hypothetical protein